MTWRASKTHCASARFETHRAANPQVMIVARKNTCFIAAPSIRCFFQQDASCSKPALCCHAGNRVPSPRRARPPRYAEFVRPVETHAHRLHEPSHICCSLGADNGALLRKSPAGFASLSGRRTAIGECLGETTAAPIGIRGQAKTDGRTLGSSTAANALVNGTPGANCGATP